MNLWSGTSRLLVAVALLAPLLALALAEVRVGRTLERRVYDGWFTLRGPLETPSEVVVVAIDLDAEAALGRYPWSREWHARLVRNLTRAGASVVAFDATFADAFPVQDTLLRRAIDTGGNVILGAKTVDYGNRFSEGFRLEEPAGALAGAPIGIVDIYPDAQDGIVREYPLLTAYASGHVVPQLGLQAVLTHLGLPTDSVVPEPDGWRFLGRRIPAGPGGDMLINYLGPARTVTTYSYLDVVDDSTAFLGEAHDLDVFHDMLADGWFRDRIVLVGSTVPEHQDLHLTPLRDAAGGLSADRMAGVEIHAHAVATLLSGRHLDVLPRRIQYGWTFLLALLIVLAVARLRALRGVGVAGLVVLAAVAVAAVLFVREGLWLWSVAPVLSVGLAYSGSAGVLYFTEEREKARIRGMFSQYVASSVVDELIQRPELLSLGGEERVATVLFSDIVAFSSVSERLTPTELVAQLNEYLTRMTDVVVAHGGIIDKYQGDALMAEFGVPVGFEGHAAAACRAGLEMQRVLSGLREGWRGAGKPELEARVGINTGPMLVGNLGSRRVMDYTVMGDHVNLASRLEGANKVYGTSVLVSEFTWRTAGEALVGREIDRVRVKGKVDAVGVYELLGTRDRAVDAAAEALVEAYGAALGHYRARRFEAAAGAFSALAAAGDGPARVMAERCRAWVERPPAADWDGVYTMDVK